MQGKFLLISGSAEFRCPRQKLEAAIDFVQRFTQEVLTRGGGLVVLGSNESATIDESGRPHIFDWVVLREVEKYASTTTESPRILVKVLMSSDARRSKFSHDYDLVLKNLEQRSVIDTTYIRRAKYTGGEYRRNQFDVADAMLAIGGGKGHLRHGIGDA